MRRETAQTLLDIPPGKVCKLCCRKKPYASYVYRERDGKEGVSARCYECRNRGRRDAPGTPKLRYPLTNHAVERYVERVRPSLAQLDRGEMFRAARLEMRLLMASAPWSNDWPDWQANGQHQAKDPPGFLIVMPGVLFTLAKPKRKRGWRDSDRIVITVLTAPWFRRVPSIHSALNDGGADGRGDEQGGV